MKRITSLLGLLLVLPSLALAQPSWVLYPSAAPDRLPIPALVWAPATPSTAGVVFVHGGFGASIAWTEAVMGARLQELADAGYWVIGPDYRGSSGHGAAFEALADPGGFEVDDVAGAAAWLRAQGVTRLVVLGLSHGGLITGGIAFRSPELADGWAIVSAGGDWSAIYAQAAACPLPRCEQLVADLERSMGGSPTTAPEAFAARSLQWNADAVRRPLFLAHGTEDTIVPPALTLALAGALADAQQRVTVDLYPDAGHEVLWSAAWADVRRWLEARVSP